MAVLTGGMQHGLIHIIYASAAVGRMSETDLTTILRKARLNNAAQELTGMLLHSNGTFFQVLEGPATTAERIFEVIKRDPRHHSVTRIISEPIRRRSFQEWTMGFAQASPAELASVDGLNDFFAGGGCLAELDRGRAKKLLAAFALGRWTPTIANRVA